MRSWMTCGLTVGAFILACANPAADRLAEADALRTDGDLAGAVVIYEAIAAEWPDTEEAHLAGLHAPLLHREILEKRVAEESWIDAANQAVSILDGPWRDTLAPDIARLRNVSKPLDITLRWTTGSEAADARADLALGLLDAGETSWLEEDLKAWLGANLGDAWAPRCTGRMAGLDQIDDLEEVGRIVGACETIVEHTAETDGATSSQAAIDGPLAERASAIKSSPAYRTEAALTACRSWNAWLASEKSAIRSLARQGKYEAAEKRAWRFQEQVESRGPRELIPHLDYLRQRMNELESMERRAALVRRISRDCQ